ncbi:MAG: hypothetical protein V1685_06350, partial [Parcubacteria group bacterium]
MRRVVLLAIVIVFVAGLFFSGLFLFRASKQSTPPQNVSVNTPVSNTVNISPPQADQTKKEAIDRARLATNFAERYGTYSNESDFKNIESMYDAMTESFRGEVAQFVESARKNLSAPGSYYGTLTRVRSIEKELAISETVVEYLIMTQRVEETGDASRTYY